MIDSSDETIRTTDQYIMSYNVYSWLCSGYAEDCEWMWTLDNNN